MQFETNPRLKADWQVAPLLNRPGKSLKWNYLYDNGTRFGSVGGRLRVRPADPPADSHVDSPATAPKS